MDKYEHVSGLSSMDKFMEMEEILMDENEDVIVSLGLLDSKDGNNKLEVHFILCYLHLSSIFFLQI
jgi:hypothetical protein